MKNYKNIMGIMMLIWLSILLTGCLFTFTDPTVDDPSDFENGFEVGPDGNLIISEAIMSKQGEYKAQWLKNTKDIRKANQWEGRSDLWAGGSFGKMHFFFDENGDFWSSKTGFFYYDEIYLKLISDNPLTFNPDGVGSPERDAESIKKLQTRFLNGHTAVVYIIATTSDEMRYTLYLLQVTNNTTHDLILKTKDAWGWSGRGSSPKVVSGKRYWDDKTIPTHEMIVIASNKTSPDIGSDYITLDVEKQAEYKAQWLKDTAHITRGTYEGKNVDMNDMGPWNVSLWFENEMLYSGNPENINMSGTVRYKLVTDDVGNKEVAFVDGNTAIMYYTDPYDFFGTLDESLFIVQVKDNKIYRTEKVVDGFAKLDTWDGIKVPKSAFDNLVPIAEKVK